MELSIGKFLQLLVELIELCNNLVKNLIMEV